MSKVSKILKIAIGTTLAIAIFTRVINWREEVNWAVELENFFIVFVFALGLTIVSVFYNDFIAKKFSWSEQPQKRLLVGSIGSVLILFLVYVIARLILFLGYFGWSIDKFVQNEEATPYSVFILISVVASLFFHAVYFYKALQENKVKEQKIIAGTASAKFDALKNQLDPHFLFNSLNVLTSLIEEDPYQAQKFTTSLSKVYRYVLEQKNKDLVSVDEELKFAKTYVRLLKMRFEDSIVLEIPDASSDPDAKIVPLSLQLLLENAVKHNIVTADKPLHIKVTEEDGKLVVSNNIQEKQVVKKSSGVGLQNIKQRYAILTDKRVVIQKSKSEFSVELPILTKQITIMETQQVYIDDKLYKKAKERVDNIKGFYSNVLAYCIVIPCLAILNYNTTSFPWIVFPAFGWGFGVLMHGMEVFGYNPLLGKGWEDRKIKEYMEDDSF